jgi:hypothetical protein
MKPIHRVTRHDGQADPRDAGYGGALALEPDGRSAPRRTALSVLEGRASRSSRTRWTPGDGTHEVEMVHANDMDRRYGKSSHAAHRRPVTTPDGPPPLRQSKGKNLVAFGFLVPRSCGPSSPEPERPGPPGHRPWPASRDRCIPKRSERGPKAFETSPSSRPAATPPAKRAGGRSRLDDGGRF